MANEDKKDFNAMLHDSKDMPKFQTITDEKSILYFGIMSLFIVSSEDKFIDYAHNAHYNMLKQTERGDVMSE